ncbi:MAG: type II toxin-antitoxin system Phd/YefM family antitoxin [Bacteroidetes bacterium]|nr:type II toxin-antitoxin system Phd/YefM family antitoxin [Bacteroidota bacterium]
MAIIKPISDLRNKSNEISEMAHAMQEPIYITKNGEGDLVVMSIQEYRKLERRLDLFAKLSVAQAQWDEGDRGRPYQDVMKSIRKRIDERKSNC